MAEYRLDLVGNTEDLTAALTDVSKSLTEIGSEAVETSKKTQAAFNQTGGVEKFDKSLKSQVLTLAKLEAEMKKIITAKKTAFDGKEAAALDVRLKSVATSLQAVDAEIGSVSDSNKSLKAQLRENKEILAQMEEQGLETTQTFFDLSVQTGKLQDQIQDTNERIKFFASDTKGLDGLIAVTKLATAGFAVGSGAAALFGAENENVQKALLKVNAAMAILTGLQEIQQALQKSSAARITIETALRKIKTFVIGQEVVATNALTTSELAAAAAAKVLRAALLATGAGAVLFLIGSIISAVSAMSKFKEETESTTDEIKKQDEALKDLQSTLDFNTKKQLADAKRLGANNETLRAIEEQGLKDNLTALNNNINDKRALLDKAQAESLKALKEGDNEEIKLANDRFAEAKQSYKEALDLAKEASRELTTFRINAQTESNNEVKEANEKFDEKQKQDDEKRRQAQIDRININNQNRIAAMQDGIDKELALLEESKRLELQAAKKSGANTLLIEAKFAKERSDIILKYDKIKSDADFKLAAEQKQLETEFIQDQFKQIDNLEKIRLLELEIEAATGEKSVKQLRELEKKKNDILLAAAEERLSLLKATEGSEEEIKSLELAIINFKKNVSKEDSLFESLNLSPEQAEAIVETYNAVLSSIKSIVDDGINAAIEKNNELLSSLDSQISESESNLEKQKELAREGQANDLELEKERLEKLEAERRAALERDKKLQKQKLNADAITQISSLITASAQIFQAYSGIPGIGVPLAIATIAAMFAAFASTQIRARESIKSQEFGEGGWIDGKPHSQGGVKYYSNDGNIELEGNEYVTRKQQAAKYAGLLEAINSDRLKSMDIDELLRHTGVSLSKEAIDSYKLRLAGHRKNEQIQSAIIHNEYNPEIKKLREDFNRFVEQRSLEEKQIVAGDYLIAKKGNRTIRKKL